MTQHNLSFVTGRQLADAGMHRALTSAAQAVEDWPERAMQALREYLFMHPKQEFMTETVRTYAYAELGLPQPPHDRAWGGIMVKAAKENLIVRVRLAPVKTVSSHMANASVWRAA